MSSSGHKTARKFPPPCWTRDEALVLIEAYRERWYALNRQFLRNPDWDMVAEKVTTACPEVTPPKTAAQCRHKMEKLRQRHKVEKQRAAMFTGERFFSSWYYFEAMEAMDPGPEPGSGLKAALGKTPDSASGRGKLQALGTSSAKRPNPSLDSRVRVSGRNPLYLDSLGSDEEPEFETPFRSKPTITTSSREREPARSGLRPRKFIKVNEDDEEEDEEMWVKVPYKSNVFVRGNNKNVPNVNNVNHSMPSVRNVDKGKEKRKGGGMADIVTSIRLLGDGFMKMEKMKIDMAKEIEKMRMDTEMKRNQLILDSQRQIIEAFVNGVVEARKRGSGVDDM